MKSWSKLLSIRYCWKAMGCVAPIFYSFLPARTVWWRQEIWIQVLVAFRSKCRGYLKMPMILWRCRCVPNRIRLLKCVMSHKFAKHLKILKILHALMVSVPWRLILSSAQVKILLKRSRLFNLSFRYKRNFGLKGLRLFILSTSQMIFVNVYQIYKII